MLIGVQAFGLGNRAIWLVKTLAS